MFDNFQGDPRLFQGVDGSFLQFNDGQPMMDSGFENQAEIALLTTPGWVGNYFLNPDSQIGSDFIPETQKSITITTLNKVRQAGERALASPSYGSVAGEVINPESTQIKASFIITPPGETAQEIRLTGAAQNWKSQAVYPAHRRE